MEDYALAGKYREDLFLYVVSISCGQCLFLPHTSILPDKLHFLQIHTSQTLCSISIHDGANNDNKESSDKLIISLVICHEGLIILILYKTLPLSRTKTQGFYGVKHSAPSLVIIFYFLGYYTNSWKETEGKVNDLSSLDHHCLCMSPFLCPSVKAPMRTQSYLSQWSPYLVSTPLLPMILKPLFSLKRVCPVPVRGEEQIVDEDRKPFISQRKRGFTRTQPLCPCFALPCSLVQNQVCKENAL